MQPHPFARAIPSLGLAGARCTKAWPGGTTTPPGLLGFSPLGLMITINVMLVILAAHVLTTWHDAKGKTAAA